MFAAFQSTFAAITCALIVGSYAERIKFAAVLLFSVLWFTFGYLPLAAVSIATLFPYDTDPSIGKPRSKGVENGAQGFYDAAYGAKTDEPETKYVEFEKKFGEALGARADGRLDLEAWRAIGANPEPGGERHASGRLGNDARALHAARRDLSPRQKRSLSLGTAKRLPEQRQ